MNDYLHASEESSTSAGEPVDEKAGGTNANDITEDEVVRGDATEFEAKPIDDGERADNVRAVRTPGQPTQAEREEHNLTHCPYRSWCRVCVEAMGREDPHKKGKEMGALSELAYDYAYVNSKDEERVRRGEKKPEDVTRLIFGKDRESSAHVCHFVPRK